MDFGWIDRWSPIRASLRPISSRPWPWSSGGITTVKDKRWKGAGHFFQGMSCCEHISLSTLFMYLYVIYTYNYIIFIHKYIIYNMQHYSTWYAGHFVRINWQGGDHSKQGNWLADDICLETWCGPFEQVQRTPLMSLVTVCPINQRIFCPRALDMANRSQQHHRWVTGPKQYNWNNPEIESWTKTPQIDIRMSCHGICRYLPYSASPKWWHCCSLWRQSPWTM